MTVENFTLQAFPAWKRFLKFSVFHKWIKNLCLIPDEVPWAGQWKGLPWAIGIPDEWVPGLRRHCGATGTARNPVACKAVQNLFYHDATLLNGPVSCRKKDKEHLHKDPFDKYPGWSPWVHWSRDAYLYGLWSDRSWILRKDRLTQFLRHAECIPNRIRRCMIGYSDMDTMKNDADSWCMISIYHRMRQCAGRYPIRNIKTDYFLFFRRRGPCDSFREGISFLSEPPHMIIKCFGRNVMVFTPGFYFSILLE